MCNFSVFGLQQNDDGSVLGKSDGSIGYPRSPLILNDVEDLRPCSFSDSLGERFATGSTPISYMKVRVIEDDIVAFAPNQDNLPYPVVTSPLISLDVIGAPGTYAVRVRNDNDADFSPWIPVGGDIPVLPLSVTDSSDYRSFQDIFRARFTSRDRFTLPWLLSAGTGMKTVCVEALTFFGKTTEFCTSIICQPSMPDYSIKFYAQSEAIRIPLSRFKEYPVASPFAFAIDKPQVANNDLRSLEEDRLSVDSIYFEVTFDNYGLIDKLVRLGGLSFFKKRLRGRSAVTSSVTYRGIEKLEIDLDQDPVIKNKFSGSIVLKRSDGIFRKDGLALIGVDVPLLGVSGDYSGFIRQMQELKGQTPNVSSVELRPTSKMLIPPIDENSISRAFGNSEYYS